MATKKKAAKANQPWNTTMPDEQFALMRDILAAPSPVSLEGAMTFGVLKPYFETFAPKNWKVQAFKGNASVVLDTMPEDDGSALKVMVIGHADKIRLQVRSIGEDGKIWIDSDSFLPGTLLGHEVVLFSQKPGKPGEYRSLRGGTIEALGAIHFADAGLRNGDKGIRKNMLYLELQIHGDDKKKQVEALGIRPGDPILLDRPIRRGFSPDTFVGAYLDNGLGCFACAEIARLIAERGGMKNVRGLFAMASQEEIGRFGSRVVAGELRPDVIIALDVNHDYVAARGIVDRRLTPLAMGKGFTLTTGSITSAYLNTLIEKAALKHDIPTRSPCRVVTRAQTAWLASSPRSTPPRPRSGSDSEHAHHQRDRSHGRRPREHPRRRRGHPRHGQGQPRQGAPTELRDDPPAPRRGRRPSATGDATPRRRLASEPRVGPGESSSGTLMGSKA